MFDTPLFKKIESSRIAVFTILIVALVGLAIFPVATVPVIRFQYSNKAAALSEAQKLEAFVKKSEPCLEIAYATSQVCRKNSQSDFWMAVANCYGASDTKIQNICLSIAEIQYEVRK